MLWPEDVLFALAIILRLFLFKCYFSFFADLVVLTLARQSRLLSSAPLVCLRSYAASIANTIDLDQTAQKEQSDLGPYCLFP